MKNPLRLLAFASALVATSFAQNTPQKIAIIKADDVSRPTENWDRFIAVSGERGIKVSIGIICNSLATPDSDYLAWLRAHDRSGKVEFWNHGWDHERWTTEAGLTLSEFKGSGFEHQNQHYADAKAAVIAALGAPPVAFGAPFNAVDDETFKILNADADLKLYFGYTVPQGIQHAVVAPMALRAEPDGTGKPNFEKFLAEYKTKPDLALVALQFHPGIFTDGDFAEYARMLDFLLAEGWSFMLPREYVALRADSSR